MGGLASHSPFTRRSFMRSAAGAGLCGAAGSVLDLIAGPASAANYRGVVGDIKPRATDSGLVDMIRLLPEGIGVIPVFLNLSQGTREEYVGNFDNPRGIFWHTGPSDGTTANIGSTTVAYTIQVGALQEAGNDYTNTLTYVATPTF